MKIQTLISLLLSIIIITVVAYSCYTKRLPAREGVAQKPTVFTNLLNENVQVITIDTDVQNLIDNKQGTKTQEATIQWTNNGKTYQETIKVSPRGKTRRSVCNFPPLKLRFEENQMMASCLKLVTHCIDDQELVLKEYLAYKLYNQLTENSFKVQLVQIHYVDQQDTLSRYGFVIENKKEMAARLGGTITKKEELRSIHAEQYRILTLYQYMIGNTDWNLSKQHNLKMVRMPASNTPVPVPYDFDWSGLVNAPYAKPHPQLPIQDVRDRLFQWRGGCTKSLATTIEHFIQHKEDLIGFCEGFDLLKEETKTEMVEYLNEFFEIIETPNKWQAEVLANV